MKRLLVNTFVGLFSGGFLLLDYCLIETAGMPLSGEVAFLLLLQASTSALVALIANGAFPTVVAMTTDCPGVRTKLFVYGLPLILFLISPVMISDSMNRARYGNLNKFLVHAHVWRDLACCLNPFAAKK